MARKPVLVTGDPGGRARSPLSDSPC